jgi:hypothetical protein
LFKYYWTSLTRVNECDIRKFRRLENFPLDPTATRPGNSLRSEVGGSTYHSSDRFVYESGQQNVTVREDKTASPLGNISSCFIPFLLAMLSRHRSFYIRPNYITPTQRQLRLCLLFCVLFAHLFIMSVLSVKLSLYFN